MAIAEKSRSTTFNAAQQQILHLLDRVSSETEVAAINRLLTDYFHQKMLAEGDRLWAEGQVTAASIDELLNTHPQRTPYARP